MNIFIFDLNIKKNVKSYCDDHIRKMPIETAQMLSYCHHLFPNENDNIEELVKAGVIHEYQQARANHPCSKWVRESIFNFQYLLELGVILCEEFNNRFGHNIKSREKILWMRYNFLSEDKGPNLPLQNITPFPQCIPDKYKVKTGNFDEDIVKAYRNYFIGEKASWATWNRGGIIPEWLPEEIRVKKKLDKIDWLEKQRINALKIRVGSEIKTEKGVSKIIGYYSNNRIYISTQSEQIEKIDIIEVIKF